MGVKQLAKQWFKGLPDKAKIEWFDVGGSGGNPIFYGPLEIWIPGLPYSLLITDQIQDDEQSLMITPDMEVQLLMDDNAMACILWKHKDTAWSKEELEDKKFMLDKGLVLKEENAWSKERLNGALELWAMSMGRDDISFESAEILSLQKSKGVQVSDNVFLPADVTAELQALPPKVKQQIVARIQAAVDMKVEIDGL